MLLHHQLTPSPRHGSRSKYILKPENVLEVGNHNIWQFRVGKRQVKVNETLGLSHHYRICEFGGFACMKRPLVIEGTLIMVLAASFVNPFTF